MNNKDKNPLLCDPEDGVCEIPGYNDSIQVTSAPSTNEKIKITYYTDPICSSCWGIEPQLRKLKLEYGDNFEIDYRMGGLLPDWSYNNGGISKPSDVAHHWEEVSAYYDMPIDGDVWLEDPLPSSYPPSIAVKAAQLQNKETAVRFMRKLRELLFLDKKNITRWEVIHLAASAAGLDTSRFKEDYEGNAKTLFLEDLAYAQKLGVRAFPTLFFTNKDNSQTILKGFKPYEAFESALLEVLPEAKKAVTDLSSDHSLFDHYPTLTIKEYSVIMGVSMQEAQSKLENLVRTGIVNKQTVKTGVMYKLNGYV